MKCSNPILVVGLVENTYNFTYFRIFIVNIQFSSDEI